MSHYIRDVLKIIDRRSMLALLLTSIIVTVLEAASISAVIPAIGLILGGNVSPHLSTLFSAVGMPDPGTQKVTLLVAIASVFLCRGVFLSVILFVQSRITFNAQKRLSSLLYAKFLSARFEKLTDVASSTLVRTSTTELANITHGVLLPIAVLASEMALVLGSLLVLFVLQPTAALGLVLGTAALSMPIIRLNRERLTRLGQTRHDMEENRVRLAQEMAAGIREVKVYRLEQQLQDTIDRTNQTYAGVLTRINFLQSFPRVYFETTGMCLLLLICAVQLARGTSATDILMFLTVAGLAAFRALPSVAKVLSQLQALRFYRPSLTTFLGLMDQLEAEEPPAALPPEAPTSEQIALPRRIRLELRDASYRHAPSSPLIFSNVDLTLRSGDVVGLVGPSGAGKSTLLDCLIGLRKLTSGSVRTLLDEPTRALVTPRVSYVPQNPVMMDGTVRRNILLSHDEAPQSHEIPPHLGKALQMSGFDTLMASRQLSLESKVVEGGRNLSGGQRQRLALARALLRDADILVLDESTSALDNEAEQAILETIRTRCTDQLVIVVTHRVELLRYCDTVIHMETGGKVEVRTSHQAPSGSAAGK